MAATREQPPANVLEALERAGAHARQSAVELALAVRALVDAVSLGWTGAPSEANAALRMLSSTLEELADRLGRGGSPLPDPIARTVLAAVEAEIAKWEERSAVDDDARAVLRAFLGVRELLWELGVRPDQERPTQERQERTRKEKAAPAGDEVRVSGVTSQSAPEQPPNTAGARVRRLSRVEVSGEEPPSKPRSRYADTRES